MPFKPETSAGQPEQYEGDIVDITDAEGKVVGFKVWNPNSQNYQRRPISKGGGGDAFAAAGSPPGAQTTTTQGAKQPIRRKAPDGRMALYDPDTKAFLGYQE